MSMENVNNFMKVVVKDKNLLSKVLSIPGDEVVALGSQMGYVFTKEEYFTLVAEIQEVMEKKKFRNYILGCCIIVGIITLLSGNYHMMVGAIFIYLIIKLST